MHQETGNCANSSRSKEILEKIAAVKILVRNVPLFTDLDHIDVIFIHLTIGFHPEQNGTLITGRIEIKFDNLKVDICTLQSNTKCGIHHILGKDTTKVKLTCDKVKNAKSQLIFGADRRGEGIEHRAQVAFVKGSLKIFQAVENGIFIFIPVGVAQDKIAKCITIVVQRNEEGAAAQNHSGDQKANQYLGNGAESCSSDDSGICCSHSCIAGHDTGITGCNRGIAGDYACVARHNTCIAGYHSGVAGYHSGLTGGGCRNHRSRGAHHALLHRGLNRLLYRLLNGLLHRLLYRLLNGLLSRLLSRLLYGLGHATFVAESGTVRKLFSAICTEHSKTSSFS